MALQQKLKIRIELGPDIPSQVAPFSTISGVCGDCNGRPPGYDRGNLYRDAELVGTKDGVTATLTIQKTNGGMSSPIPATIHFQFESKGLPDEPALSRPAPFPLRRCSPGPHAAVTPCLAGPAWCARLEFEGETV